MNLNFLLLNYILHLILLGIGALAGGKTGGYGSSSRDRLVYLTTCLIGHPVEVHVENGSIYTGIFHATGAEKDFGMVFYLFLYTNYASVISFTD